MNYEEEGPMKMGKSEKKIVGIKYNVSYISFNKLSQPTKLM